MRCVTENLGWAVREAGAAAYTRRMVVVNDLGMEAGAVDDAEAAGVRDDVEGAGVRCDVEGAGVRGDVEGAGGPEDVEGAGRRDDDPEVDEDFAFLNAGKEDMIRLYIRNR